MPEKIALGRLMGFAFADKLLACFHIVVPGLSSGGYLSLQWLLIYFEEAAENAGET